MSGRILFYAQHLMGVGHVFRAKRIVEALADTGSKVDLVYGGKPVPHFDAFGADVHYLPPLRGGSTTFNELEDAEGNVVDNAYKERRRDMLLSIFESARHDAIITEAFPFGRRQMRFELMPLLEAAISRADRPLIIASIRDMLQENRKPGRNEETIETLRRFYGHVLIHGDPELIGLEATFPLFAEIQDMVQYTGIVAPKPPKGVSAEEKFDVVISVGGGALGHELLVAAMGAKERCSLSQARWCAVTGANVSGDAELLQDRADAAGIELKTFLPDLCSTLANSQLSISRCGYNTTADIFVSGCRSIVVPLSDGTETEQLRRSEILDEKGLAIRVDPRDQTPDRLAAAIDRAMSTPAPSKVSLDLRGAETTAHLVNEILAGRK